MITDQRELLVQELEAARKRLLDLNLRNRLLNYKFSKVKTIDFENCSIESLLKKLIEEKKISFRSTGLQNAKDELEDQDDIWIDPFINDDREESKADGSVIYVNIKKEDIQSKLHRISKLADSFFDEQGYSILFVALGFIHWIEPKTNSIQKAPLILVPVELKRSNIGKPYRLHWTGDELITNVCMIEKAKELGIVIPEYAFNDEASEIISYFNTIKDIISTKGWTIEERCCLDFFSFTKFVLWKDLDINSWKEGENPLDNELIKTMLLTDNDIQVLNEDNQNFNRELPAREVYHILDADPSQIAVIEAVKRGASIVVEGPPGTGKSQTIANIIAELLGIEKSILFVSEKMAALEVVKSRLEKCGLGEYCLELHSRKTNKKDFIKTLTQAFMYKDKQSSKVDLDVYAKLETQKKQLNDYAETLEQRFGARGFSVFALMSLKESINRHFEISEREYTSLTIPDASEINGNMWNQILDELSEISLYAKQIPNISANPWVDTDPVFYLSGDIEEFSINLSDTLESWKDYSNMLDFLENEFGVVKPTSFYALQDSVEAAFILMDMRFVSKKVLSNPLWESENNDPCSIIRYLHEFNSVRSQVKTDPDISASEASELWDRTLPYIRYLRKTIQSITNLVAKTRIDYHGSISRLQDFLEACKVVAESPFQDLECLRHAKWKDHTLANDIVQKMADTQKQYDLARNYFPAEFLREDHAAAIDYLIDHRNDSLWFLKQRYWASKRIISKNIIDKTALRKAGFSQNLGIIRKYYQLKKEILEYSEDGKALFDLHWKELKSDVEKLKDIINWQKRFQEYDKQAFYKDDTYDTICHSQKPIELTDCIDQLSKLVNSSQFSLKDIMPSLGFNPGKETTFSEVFSTAIRQLKYLRVIKFDEKARALYGYLWDSIDTSEADLLHYGTWRSKFTQAILDNRLDSRAMELLDLTDKDILKIKENSTKLDSHKELIQHSKQLLAQLGFSDEGAEQVFSKDISSHIYHLSRWKDGSHILGDWIDYLRVKKNCKHKQCLLLAAALEKGTIEYAEDVIPIFKASYAETLLKKVLSQSDILVNFKGVIHEKRRDEFSILDKKVIELNGKRLAAKLSQARPKFISNASNNSEMGFLKAEINKKRAYKPIRQILSKAGNLIKKAKPCFMMSPLSIAQYLDPQAIGFDTIIFDEASQVKPEDALGSLMRGRQLVVMGDTMQLPPTTFFEHYADDEYDKNNENDLGSIVETESILQQSRKVLPLQVLEWHYRSKHESLIQKSNEMFYKNRLQVFPSAYSKNPNIGLHFIHLPETVYDRGKSACNRLEAKEVVELACQHYINNPELSLGIGTFSVRQQEAILYELEIKLRKNPDLQPHFAKDKFDHFFVKNLETIQGDERDVIIISIGYGKDKDGNLSMNFGPLNHEGGDRRLNVLITRAKYKCIVVCNFLDSDLKVSANASQGLKALQEYLHYARTGEMEKTQTSYDAESLFEDSIYEFLDSSGYNVVKQVGCAGYRIDMAIIHPRDPSRYVLGIECDGAMYHTSKTARERDRLRQEVLENLGWKIHRIWATDWYRNRQKSIEQLVRTIDLALNSANPDQDNQFFISKTPINTEQKNKSEANFETISNESNSEQTLQLPEYKFCETINLDPKIEIQNVHQQDLLQAIVDIVHIEAPIHMDDVITRIRTLAGYPKDASMMKETISESLRIAENKGLLDLRNGFVWRKNTTKATPRFRSHQADLDKICDEEIEELIYLVLEYQMGTLRYDLCQQVSRLFGIQRLTARIKNRLDIVIDSLIDKERILINHSDYIYLPN